MAKVNSRSRFHLPPVRVGWASLMSVRTRLAALSRAVRRKPAKSDALGQHLLPGLEYLREKMSTRRASIRSFAND